MNLLFAETEIQSHYRPEKDFDLPWQVEEEEDDEGDEEDSNDGHEGEDTVRLHRDDIDVESEALERKVFC